MTRKKKSLFTKKELLKTGKDSLLGVIILSLVSMTLNFIQGDFFKNKEIQANIRQEIVRKYEKVRDNLSSDINKCLTEKALTQADKEKRFELHAQLVEESSQFKELIPPHEYFKIAKLGRFDSSENTRNLCSLNKDELNALLQKLATFVIEL